MPKIPGTDFSRIQLANAFFLKGRSCLEAGQILYKNNNGRSHNCHEILLVHGIELLLSAFILSHDNEFKNGRDIYNKFHHKYGEIFDYCKSIDSNGVLKQVEPYVRDLAENFFEDTVEARFPTKNRLDTMPRDTYDHLLKYLVPDVKNVLPPLQFKSLKFKPHLVKQILEGTKNSTWRLFDDKNLSVGDEVEFTNSETGVKFGMAVITDIKVKTLGFVTEEDFEGQGKYSSEQEMYEHYRSYYGDKVGPDTQVKIIKFKFPWEIGL